MLALLRVSVAALLLALKAEVSILGALALGGLAETQESEIEFAYERGSECAHSTARSNARTRHAVAQAVHRSGDGNCARFLTSDCAAGSLELPPGHRLTSCIMAPFRC